MENITRAIRAVRTALAELERLVASPGRAPNVRQAVADFYGLTEEQLIGPSRVRRISTARSVLCYIERTEANKTYTEIGESIARDHTTVIYLVREIATRLLADERLAKQVETINTLLHGAQTID